MNTVGELPSALEAEVLKKLLEGDLPELGILQRQLSSARVRHREWTGVGFWTDLEVEDAAPPLGHVERIQITGVYAKHPQLTAGIGFALWVDRGRLESLEGYTYEEPWPNDLGGLEFEQDPVGEARAQGLAAQLRGRGGASDQHGRSV